MTVLISKVYMLITNMKSVCQLNNIVDDVM